MVPGSVRHQQIGKVAGNMFQENWAWCNRCQGLFFAGNNTLGSCPAPGGGPHKDTGSGDYVLATSGGGQSDWAWCNKCQGLFFFGNNTLGFCSAGDTHDGTGSSIYILATSGGGQPGWSWCNRCQGLFFTGNNTLGFCPAPGGGPHSAVGSGDYPMAQLGSNSNFILADECNPILGLTAAIYVTQDMICESASGQTKGLAFQLNCYSPRGETSAWQQYCLILWDADQSDWRWCNRCQGLFFAGNNTLGFCPAGGAHNDTGSGDYALATSAKGQSDSNCQPGWSWCNRCQGLFFAGNNMFGICPAPGDGPHSNTGSGDYKLATSGNGQSDWRWCNRCQGLFFAGNNTLGTCPAGGAHNDTSSGDYILATSRNGQLQGMIDNWPVSGPNIINNIFHVATLPGHEIPAGYQLGIWLENDLTEDITGVRFIVTDDSGNELGNVVQKLVSDVDGTPAAVAPIVAFELNLVGPINGESAVLSSGAGTITYSAVPPLTALLQEPACTESGYITAETANSFYSVLPDSPANSLTQSFDVSSTRGMIRKEGKLRPETRFSSFSE
jgi:hypothetical protein